MKRAALALLVMTVLGAGSTAAAVGYDIPILYSARHIGAAGAAVGGVDDSSAIFHNPAGMGQIGKGNLLLDVSLLTGGLRFDWNQFSLMSDFEWGFNSQNDRIAIETVDVDGNPGSIANVFEWKDQWTLRTGVEYRVYEEKIPLRLGFIYDSKATNFKYPSGFSTPPVHTYSLTAGIGYDHGPWEINIAYARRFGKVLIDDPDNPLTPTTQDDSLTRGELIAECPACGYAGDYRFRINGFYLDSSWDWQ